MKRITVGQFFGYTCLYGIAGMVLAFLGMHSLNFFQFTFPGDQQLYAYLGFGMTGGAFIGYIVIFKTLANTEMKKYVSISMIALCLIGELATAGFGMQLAGYKEAGLTFTAEDIDMMIWAIRLLGVVHGIALVLEFVGDDILKAFGIQTSTDEPIPAPAIFQPSERTFEQNIPAPIEKEAGEQPSPFLKAE